ncbi:SRPBCC family protein [Paenibacillus sp. HB172176]|uniref:SRPBCC family protein n=1 Tax=Paenibacillus sp. HB172176 TaxID=2493690 RepID=UPI001F0D9F10|nr:SRPBCC family protein [Paenibacillus sp. HB172176]
MEAVQKSSGSPERVTVEAIVHAPVDQVWSCWTEPEHIKKWNAASDDWHTTRAENDLSTGGKFMSRMEAKDGSFGFDFGGVYDEVRLNEYIAYTMDDGRKVEIVFEAQEGGIKVIETFDAETTNSIEMQRGGWNAILGSFKTYAEGLK